MTDKELLEQFQLLAGMIGNVESRLTEKIEESETRVKIFIENQMSDKISALSDKISALFDGYKSAPENQALLEMVNKTLIQRLDAMETRLAVLESRTS